MLERLQEWPARVWCRLTGGIPVWVRDDSGQISIKVARRRFDPFDDDPPLTIRTKKGKSKLDPDGTITLLAYGLRWRWKHVRKDLHAIEVLRR